MHRLRKFGIFFIVISFIISVVHAHGMEEEQENTEEQESKEEYRTAEQLIKTTVQYTIIVTIIVILLIFISLFCKKTEARKWFLFLGIAIPVVLVTLYAAGATIYLNVISETKGPVHWHADYEIWHCGEQLTLVDPNGLTNRLGTPLFHEHNDNRIHVEGVVHKKSDVSLQKFFTAVGGMFRTSYLALPTDEGLVEIHNGDLCNEKHGTLQVFLYRVINPDLTKKSGWLYEQIKLDDFTANVLAPYATIPPGDCFIIEFDEEKEKTDKLCETYTVALQEGKMRMHNGS